MPVYNQNLILKKIRIYINTFLAPHAKTPEAQKELADKLNAFKTNGVGTEKLFFLLFQSVSKPIEALEVLNQCQIQKTENDDGDETEELVKLSDGLEAPLTDEEKKLIETFISSLMPDYSQNFISNRLGAYLNTFIKPTAKNSDQLKHYEAMLTTINGRGACAGYFGLIAYAFALKHMSQTNQDHKIEEKKPETPKQKDDIEWVLKVFNLLNQCFVIDKLLPDGKSNSELVKYSYGKAVPLSSEEKQNIERLISHINTLQLNSDIFKSSLVKSVKGVKEAQSVEYGQGELQKSVVDTNDKRFRKHFAMGALFTKKELVETLAKICNGTTIADEPFIISVGSISHDTGIIKVKGQYHYYDANEKKGISDPCTFEQLADKIFAANDFDSAKLSPIALRIFNFSDKKPKLPDVAELLESFTIIKENKVNFVEDNGKYCQGCTALHMAAWAGDVASVRFLLTNGADVFKVIHCPELKYPLTPLDIAKQQYHHEIRDLLLEHTRKLSDLLAAVITGNITKMRDLLTENISLINCVNNQGETLLHLAAQYGQVGVVEALLDLGMDPNIKNAKGLPPLLAVIALEGERYFKIGELLLKKGAVPDVFHPSTGITPLAFTATIGDHDKTKLLLLHGADIHCKMKTGNTVLGYVNSVAAIIGADLLSSYKEDLKAKELEKMKNLIEIKLIKAVEGWKDNPPKHKVLFGIYSTPAKPIAEWNRLIKNIVFLFSENKDSIYKKLGEENPEQINVLLEKLHRVISESQINISTPSQTTSVLLNPPTVLRDVYESFGMSQQTFAEIFLNRVDARSLAHIKF